MTEQTSKKIAEKIAKLLALSRSDNPHEAANAKRQADALIKKYNISDNDIQASNVNAKLCKSGGKYRPPVYLSVLAGTIANAFACSAIGVSGQGYIDSQIKYIGLGIKPELAAYTFEVLARQIKKDRKAYQATLKRYKPANKKRMADLFCQKWVACIQAQVHEFAGSEQEKQAIKAYKQKKYGGSLKKDDREVAQAQKNRDYDAFYAGGKAAQDVSIHKPVQTKKKNLLNTI